MELRNAIITDVSIQYDGNGLLTPFVVVSYSGMTQVIGGVNCTAHNLMYKLVKLFMLVGGASRWEDLKGKYIQIKCDANKVYAVRHILSDKEEEWIDLDNFVVSMIGESTNANPPTVQPESPGTSAVSSEVS